MAYLEYEKRPEQHIALFTMNRPERLNALGLRMFRELADAFDDFERDPEMRCALLTGTGRAFSAGADLKEMAENQEQSEGDGQGEPGGQGDGDPFGGADSFDDHDQFGEGDSTTQEIAKERLKEAVKQAAEEAEKARNWGSVSSRMRQDIMDLSLIHI